MDINVYMGCVVYLVSTVFTYILGIVSKKQGWNNNIPIPIQNIGIGSICFLLILLCNYIFKIEVNPQDIVIYLMTAMGGSGTATLGYDVSKIDSKEEN